MAGIARTWDRVALISRSVSGRRADSIVKTHNMDLLAISDVRQLILASQIQHSLSANFVFGTLMGLIIVVGIRDDPTLWLTRKAGECIAIIAMFGFSVTFVRGTTRAGYRYRFIANPSKARADIIKRATRLYLRAGLPPEELQLRLSQISARPADEMREQSS
jgi:hypothetical protein